MSGPILASLTPELQSLQQRWVRLSRPEQDELYAKEFAQPFARLFAELPLHGTPREMEGWKPRALVSVLGLSWQPVALMAAWCKPERMLIIGTQDSLRVRPGGETIVSLVFRVAGIESARIQMVQVGDPSEVEVYRAVRDFFMELAKADIPPRDVFVDPTGGKKSMSAAAALAGFLFGAPLVYVDYGQYDETNRIPIAGTEYPRLLSNPLDVLGDLERQHVFAAFNRGDFDEAARLAERLAERLYAPREGQCLAALARGYGAWDRFDFEGARSALVNAADLLDRFADQGNWNWAGGIRPTLSKNLQALEELAKVQKKPDRLEEGLPLLLWYLAAARRMLDAGKPSLAVLLTYAALERYVGLCLWVEFGLDVEDPDYERVKDRRDRSRYEEAGRVLFGERYTLQDPDGPLMFSNGARLLVALSPERLKLEDLRPLKGLMNARNKCEYEHGFLPKPPRAEDVGRHLRKAEEIVGRVSSGDLGKMLEKYRFPLLPTQSSESTR